MHLLLKHPIFSMNRVAVEKSYSTAGERCRETTLSELIAVRLLPVDSLTFINLDGVLPA